MTKKIKVQNRTSGSISIEMENGNLHYQIPQPDGFLELPKETLDRLFRNELGGKKLIEECLRIFDRATIDEYVAEGMELGVVEYDLNRKEITELLKNKSVEELKTTVLYCPNAVLENIVDIAIKLPLKDLNKIEVIEEYSGKNVAQTIENNKAEGKTQPTTKPKVTAKTPRQPKKSK